MKFPEVLHIMDTGAGNVSPEAGLESIWLKFGDMANGNGRPVFTQINFGYFRITTVLGIDSGECDPFGRLRDLLSSHIYTFGALVSWENG